MNFEEHLKARVAQVEAALQVCLTGDKAVYDAMRYSVGAGGKRLRPVFLLECCALVGGDVAAAAPFAAALECIHTYSLIHDDLPAMDNDALRRGKPTCHIQYGEATAILAGDGLLNLAFETMAQACIEEPSAQRCAAMGTIAKAAGASGMIEGQMADIAQEANNAPMSLETLAYIHQHKTAALFSAAFCAGAQLGGATTEHVETLRTVSEHFGLAFQIQDDLLDVLGDVRVLGKNTGSDAAQKKQTYVDLVGVAAAQEDVKRTSEAAIAALQTLPFDTAFLVWLLETLIHRTY